MNDEVNINLLLDRLYTTGKIDKRYMWALKDYITNLQQENKHLDEVNCKLRKGGETLKDTNKLLLQQKGQLQEDLDMLDKRIDKAIEYIKLYSNCSGNFIDDKFVIENIEEIYNGNKLLNILKGEENKESPELFEGALEQLDNLCNIRGDK